MGLGIRENQVMYSLCGISEIRLMSSPNLYPISQHPVIRNIR